MRSGIGPQPHLGELDVDVVLDLPGVGQNLQDHAAASVVYRSTRALPPAASGHGEVLGLLRSNAALDTPDLQILCIDVPLSVPSLPGPDQGYSLLVSLMAPQSRGSVQLHSAEPQAAPVLNPNYLSDRRDIDALVAGVDLARAARVRTGLSSARSGRTIPTSSSQRRSAPHSRATGGS